MSAPDDMDPSMDQAAVKTEASRAGSEEASTRTPQTGNHPSSPLKEGSRTESKMEPFHATALEEMLMTPPFDMTPDNAAGVLSSLAEASPSRQGLADILPVSFLSQLTGKLPEGADDATLPHLPLGFHSPISDSLPHSPLTPSQQTSAGDSEGRTLDS